jgi:hypothetical protein
MERAFDLIVGGTPAGGDGGGEVRPVPAPMLIGFDLDLEEIGYTGLVHAEHAELAGLSGIFGAVGRGVVSADLGRRAAFGREWFGRGEFPCSAGHNREFNREFLFSACLRGGRTC